MKPQTRRVLEVLRRRPVTLADWDRQPACDGGDRITRLAARIGELRDLGVPVLTRRVKTSGGAIVAEYRIPGVSDLHEEQGDRGARPAQGLTSARCLTRAVPTSTSGDPLANRGKGEQVVGGVEAPAHSHLPDIAAPASPTRGHASGRQANPLPAGVVAVRGHVRRVHPEPPAAQLTLEMAA